MKNTFSIFFIHFFLIFIANAQFPPTDSAYTIVFQDEFDSIYSNAHNLVIDTSKWNRTMGWNQCCNTDAYHAGCDSGWDKAYIIRDIHDTTTIKVSSGSCKLITNKIPLLYNGEVWNWPHCSTCNSINTTAVTGSLCRDSCNHEIYPDDSLCHCWTIDTIPFKYITGNLYSRPKFRYGYFELRFRFPQPDSGKTFQGNGPNFWLWGADNSIGAYYSEIDIFEMAAYDPRPSTPLVNEFTSNAHWENYLSTQNGYQHNGFHQYPYSFPANTWYKISMWWSPKFIRYYLNDSLIFEQPPYAVDSIPPDSLSAMTIIIDNNEPSFNYCTNFDSLHTQFPYTYEIDYVRVYQLKQQCDTDIAYCNSNQNTFESGLYKSVSISGSGCVDTFTNHSNITGLGVEYVLLNGGLEIDSTSSGYFDVIPCQTYQSAHRSSATSTSPQPPPDGILRKYHYK